MLSKLITLKSLLINIEEIGYCYNKVTYLSWPRLHDQRVKIFVFVLNNLHEVADPHSDQHTKFWYFLYGKLSVI